MGKRPIKNEDKIMMGNSSKRRMALPIPFLGLLLIAVLAPFDQLQRDTVFGFSLSRIVFVFTFYFFVLDHLRTRKRIYLSQLAFPLFLYLLSSVTALLEVDSIAHVDVALTNFGYVFLFIVTVNVVQTQRQAFLIFAFFTLSLSFLGLLAIYNIWTGSSLFGFNIMYLQTQSLEFEETIRLLGTSRNPNQFATLFVLSVPIYFAMFFVNKETLWQLFLVVALFLGLTCLMATQSRSALLGVSVSILFLTFCILKNRRRLRKKRLFSLAVVVLVAAAGAYIPTISKLNAFSRFKYLGVEHERKLWIWKYSAQYILSHPLGAGIGNSSEAIYNISDKTQPPRSPHNVFLSFGAERGWAALVAIVLIFGTIFSNLKRAIKKTRDINTRILLMSLMAAFVAFVVDNQFHSLAGWNVVWLFFGLIFAVIKISELSLANGTEFGKV